jgi:RHS repeat-associated protein
VWGTRYVDDLILRDRDTNADGSLDEGLYGIQDANWNVTSVLATPGVVQERYAYSPFGHVIVLTGDFVGRGSSSFNWETRITGRQLDAETGLHYYRARYYAKSLGGFVSRESIALFSQETNLYEYAGCNPPNRLDPSGLSWVTVLPFAGTADICLFTQPGTRIGDYDKAIAAAPTEQECCKRDSKEAAIDRCIKAINGLATGYLGTVAGGWGAHIGIDFVIDVVGLAVMLKAVPPGAVIVIVFTLDALLYLSCLVDALEKIKDTARWMKNNICVCP